MIYIYKLNINNYNYNYKLNIIKNAYFKLKKNYKKSKEITYC